MAAFDPYHKWLGIPPAEQPVNHYRLLGVTLFESDPDVIDAATEQRVFYLRQCATGQHIPESQKLLNEVASARLCLFNPEKRRNYDQRLRQSLVQNRTATDPVAPASTPHAMPWEGQPDEVVEDAGVPEFNSAPLRRKASPQASRRASVVVTPTRIAAAVLLLGVVIAGIAITSGGGNRTEDSDELQQASSPAAQAKVVQEKSPSITKPSVPTPPDLLDTKSLVAPKLLNAPLTAAAAKQAQEEWAKYLQTEATLVNSIDMKFALIPSGDFDMGDDSFGPVHRVRISQPFYLGVYEVTQLQYERVMGSNPSWFSRTGGGKAQVSGLDTSDWPVEQVSWLDAQEFCRKLGELNGEQTKQRRYRLPTEAEWEYACRAGTKSRFHFGDVLNGDKANVDGKFPEGATTKGPNLARPTSVGGYAANAFGLYDMHGNVWEWCEDVSDGQAYAKRSGLTKDPLEKTGSDRVLRGGSWFNPAVNAGSAYRNWYTPDYRDYDFGVRLAQVPGARKGSGAVSEAAQGPSGAAP